MDNQVPEDVIKDRFDRLLTVVQDIGRKQYDKLVGTTHSVLVENVNEKDSTLMSGRLTNNAIVHFPGDKSLIGDIVNVTLNECKGFYYIGTINE